VACLIQGPGNFRGLRLVLWQQLQVFQGGVGRLASKGGAVLFQLVAIVIGMPGAQLPLSVVQFSPWYCDSIMARIWCTTQCAVDNSSSRTMLGRRTTSSINISGVRGPNDTPSTTIAVLNVLPSLATSPNAFSLIAYDLCRASRVWLRAAASCSRDARACSSSSWTFWSYSDKRLRAPSVLITLRMVAFYS
jgi:hypothetical protein